MEQNKKEQASLDAMEVQCKTASKKKLRIL